MSNAETVLEAVARVNRRTHWEPVRRIPLAFTTHHPQGLAFVDKLTFLSSVEVLEGPLHVLDPALSTPGRGIGHLFVIDDDGKLVRDILLGEGDLYHPGGIDFDGSTIWVPVGEYRRNGKSMVLAIDPVTFDVVERFRVRDSIGWVVSDSRSGTIYGGNWGSRCFYAWGSDGEERERWDNPSNFIDYQDCQFAGDGQVVCSGISVLPQPDGEGDYELGGMAIVDFAEHRIGYETPIQLFSSAGHVVTRNPFALTEHSGDLLLHVAPDDGTEINGTELLSYKATGLGE